MEVRAMGLIEQVWDLAESMSAFVADGCKTVNAEEYSRRLSVCDQNPYHCRRGSLCTVCGCVVAIKAKGRVWQCPIGLWKR